MRYSKTSVRLFFTIITTIFAMGAIYGSPGDITFEPGYFLFPLRTEGTRAEPLRLIPLLTAPVIEPALIFREAEREEKNAREELTKRMESIRVRVCALPPEERETIVEGYTDGLTEEYNLWLTVHAQYEKAIEYRLRQTPALGYSRSLIDEILEKKKLSDELRIDRQEIIRKAWKRLFERLLDGGGCETDMASFLPGERLFLPYYHSLILFYSSIPDPHRSQIILLMRKKNPGR